MDNKIFKLPRLYTEHALKNKGVIALRPEQAHYLRNVLRRNDTDLIRLFDGENGEWLARLQNLNKKSGEALLEKQLIKQPDHKKHIHLLFSPIKKNRMDWLIEKSVELGVTALHPVLTQNTEVRKINESRMSQQILEASEQCERLDIPKLYDLKKLEKILKEWPEDIKLLTCLERHNGKNLNEISGDIGVFIGPEGGFTSQEREILERKTTIVTLGTQILRSETAALKSISILTA